MRLFGFQGGFDRWDSTPVSNLFITEYMPTAKGDHVRVYLYGLMRSHYPDEALTVEDAAAALGMDRNDVLGAFRHWEFVGLVERVGDNPPAFRYLHPAQREMEGGKQVDPKWLAFVESLHSQFGNERTLHSGEISTACEWVEVHHLPQEVVLLFVRHMIDTKGKNFSFTANYTNELIGEMIDARVATLDEAAAILERDKAVQDGARALLRRMGVSRRGPSRDELELYRKWMRDWHYTVEAIEAACVETTKTNSPSFAYIDTILRRMLEQGGSATTTEQETLALQDTRARLRRVLDILGLDKDAFTEPGTIAWYRSMREVFDDQVIEMAAKWCADENKRTLDQVQLVLERWDARGAKTAEEVTALLKPVRDQQQLLQTLWHLWGRRDRRAKQDYEMIGKWQQAWGFSTDLILAVAPWATEVERPMSYLDGILGKLHEKGIQTYEGALAEREQHQKAGFAKPAGTRVNPALNYEQRAYQTEKREMPDWLRDEMEKEEKHAE